MSSGAWARQGKK
jgi:hypothetical protein